MISARRASKCRGRFPRLFLIQQNPAIAHATLRTPTRRAATSRDPARARFPDIGPVPRVGDEDLRERVPGEQKRRELPLERQFRADVVSRLNSPSRFRNSRSFKVSKPRRQYTHGCVEGRIPAAPCRQRCRGTFAESHKPRQHREKRPQAHREPNGIRTRLPL